MEIKFLLVGQVDPIAAYAAILSTMIAVWEFLKWKARNSVKLICSPNMMMMPSTDKKKFINAVVTNQGEQATTITHFVMFHWKTRLDKFFNRNKQSFIVSSRDVPKVVQPGEQWMAQALHLEKMAADGVLYVGIFHSMGKKEVMQRVKIKLPNAEDGTKRSD